MRYLGLDLGTRTLGLSLSDTTLTIASTLKTIRYEENDYELLLNELESIIEEYNISKLILGYPKNMNNTEERNGIETALESLKRKELIFKEGHYWFVNMDKIKEIREILEN